MITLTKQTHWLADRKGQVGSGNLRKIDQIYQMITSTVIIINSFNCIFSHSDFKKFVSEIITELQKGIKYLCTHCEGLVMQ
jgi:archaellum biogenesis ATPase FlaH